MTTPQSTALFVRPDYEMVTHYLAEYSAKLVDYATEKGYIVTNLYDDDAKLPARLSAFEPAMQKKPSVFIGMGHGNSRYFTSQDYEVLIKTDVNDDICKDIPTYLWSCATGEVLGPRLVEKGCPLYLGYSSDWTFIYHPDYEDKPLEDPYAKAFFDSGLSTGYSLLAGKSPAEIYGDTIGRYTYWYEWWKKQNDPMTDDILTWLNWNRNNFIVSTPTGLYEVEAASAGASVILPIGIGVAGALLFLLSKV